MASKVRRSTQMRSKSEPGKGVRKTVKTQVAKRNITKGTTAKGTTTKGTTAEGNIIKGQAGKVRNVGKAVASPAVREGLDVSPVKAGFSAVLKGVLASVSEATRDGFVLSVVGDPKDGLDPALWGGEPSPAERREAALSNLRRQYESRRQVVESSLTRTEAAELLDVSEQAILDRLDAGDLIGLKKGREWRLPAWQFSPDSERGFVPGLAKLGEVFPGGVVSMTVWATSANVELDGATPAEELAAGHVDLVVHAARTGTAAAW
jgi:hypothetical protein